MKLLSVIPTMLLSFVLGSLLLGAPPAAAQTSNSQVLDEVVAVVGDQPILRSEVSALAQNAVRQSRGRQQMTKELWMNALNQMINQKVMAEKARQDTTLMVTDQQVDQQLNRRIQQIASQVGGESRVEEMYGKSIVQLKSELRQEFRSQLLAQQLQQRRMQDINVTPTEVRSWFEEIPSDSLPQLPEMVRLAHIVRYPQPNEAVREAAQSRLQSIRDSIVSGAATFEEMARRHSEHAGSASRGGRMQGFNINDLLPEFSAMATNLQEGEVSPIFETPQGFHIMQLNERRGDVIDFNHILIKVDQAQLEGTQAVERLEAVRDSIVNQGAPFELMAKRHSEEESSANMGGRVVDPQTGRRDLQLERLGPSWRHTIRQLEEGEVSQPTQVELLSGEQAYHIVKLQKHEPPHRLSLETDYDRIKQLALQEKQSRIMQEWLERLRDDVYVDVRVEPTEVAIR